jgi:hypothetical protein
MSELLEADVDGEYVIDMDAVADAAGKDSEKPPFFYSEQSQQKKFSCSACGAFNDILGTFGYCQLCGTRNDAQEFSETIIPHLRSRIGTEAGYEACVKDAVAAFDSLVGRLTEQLLRFVPLTRRRRSRFENRRFHNLEIVVNDLRETFDIDVLDGISAADIEFLKLMFHRRHVYEHKGGEADEKYIADSGDTSVRPKQALRETQESAHRTASLVLRMATNLQRGFHELLPPEERPIKQYERWAKPKAPSGA